MLGHYGFTEAHAEQLKKMVYNIRIEGWFPKSRVEFSETDAIILPPKTPINGGNGNGEKKEVKNDKIAKKNKDNIEISFAYNAELVAKVKTLSGRRWNNDRKIWTAPISFENIRLLKEWGFDIAPELTAEIPEIKPLNEVKIDLPEFKAPIFEFQKEAIQFIESRKGRAILGHEIECFYKTGSGYAKTIIGPEELDPVLNINGKITFKSKEEMMA